MKNKCDLRLGKLINGFWRPFDIATRKIHNMQQFPAWFLKMIANTEERTDTNIL